MEGLNPKPGNKRTGVGLIICKKLVELMGGTIKIESEAGKSSVVFTIRTVPVYNALQPVHGLDSLEGKKILVVEDNYNTCEFYKRTTAGMEAFTGDRACRKKCLGDFI